MKKQHTPRELLIWAVRRNEDVLETGLDLSEWYDSEFIPMARESLGLEPLEELCQSEAGDGKG